MYHLFVLTSYGIVPGLLAETIDRGGMSCEIGVDINQIDDNGKTPPDAVLVDLSSLEQIEVRHVIEECQDRKLPVLAVVPRDVLHAYDPSLNPDEVVVSPVSESELTTRVKLAIYRVAGPSGPKLLKVGELSIDLERYEVTVSGRRAALTYKEFQLLVLLASNPGRVYTRETLLSQIWGYDYLGGTRTVDVHIRSLRAKLESTGYSIVETIWNVGYRFREPV